MRCTTERCQHHMLEFPFIIICVGEIGTTDSTAQYASIQASSCAAYLASAMRPLPREQACAVRPCVDVAILTFGVCDCVFVYVVVVCSCVCSAARTGPDFVLFFTFKNMQSTAIYIVRSTMGLVYSRTIIIVCCKRAWHGWSLLDLCDFGLSSPSPVPVHPCPSCTGQIHTNAHTRLMMR